jgi:hypothetical protein
MTDRVEIHDGETDGVRSHVGIVLPNRPGTMTLVRLRPLTATENPLTAHEEVIIALADEVTRLQAEVASLRNAGLALLIDWKAAEEAMIYERGPRSNLKDLEREHAERKQFWEAK